MVESGIPGEALFCGQAVQPSPGCDGESLKRVHRGLGPCSDVGSEEDHSGGSVGNGVALEVRGCYLGIPGRW